MISLPFTVYCDQCGESKNETSCLVEPIILGITKGTEKTIKRFVAFEYPEELTGKGWLAIEIGLGMKHYCPACKETMANEKEED